MAESDRLEDFRLHLQHIHASRATEETPPPGNHGVFDASMNPLVAQAPSGRFDKARRDGTRVT